MAKFLENVSIQTPTKKLRDFDLSCQHLTTQGFMRPAIVYANEFTPRTKIKCNLKSYARMAPLFRPMMGSVKVRNRAFFVPFRTVWDSFNNFIVEAPEQSSGGGVSVVQQVPYFTLSTLCSVLNSVDFGYAIRFPSGESHHNAFYAWSNGVVDTNATLIITDLGKQVFKILVALGYPNTLNHITQSEGDNRDNRLSFLPLLCAAKVAIDWYYPPQYAHSGEFANIEGICARHGFYEATIQDVWSCLKVLEYVYYDADYFTSAWDSPVAPAVGTFDSSVSIPDVTNNSAIPMLVVNDPHLVGTPTNSSAVPTNGTPFVGGSGSNGTVVAGGVLTQYVVDALKALTNAQKRHQLVGARVLERYLADFGVVLSDAKMRRSSYIGSQVFPIQIQDVMSNADTSGAPLGDYAGKGLAFDGSGDFEFDTDEFGYFLIFNSVVPDVSYVGGVRRQVLHRTRLDFYNPEYDALGTQPLYSSELVETAASMYGYSTRVFGFSPRYAEYKVGLDRLSGDFLLGDYNGGLLGFSMYRGVPYNVTHSIGFLRGDDNVQYGRVFYGYNGKDDIDYFYFVHRINLKAVMGASPMYDTYQFDEPEGDDIKLKANGVMLN